MVSCFGIPLPCDQVLNEVTQWLRVQASYIHNIKKNLTALEKHMEELKAKQDDLSRWVEREENRGLRRLAQIQVWLSRVKAIESEANDLFSVRTQEFERLCFCGLCSMDLKLSYRCGKHIFMMLEEVENLKSNGNFDVVAEQAQASEVVERNINPNIVGKETVLETALNRLIDDQVGMVGLHGMGGVGKTTLLEQINNEFKRNDSGRGWVVIWVMVSKDLQIQKIQKEVAKKIGLVGEDWNRKDENQKACDLHIVLRRYKFLLLLDDIWEKVDPKKIGVPFPNRENGCKVVFTTRSQEVCGRMGVDVQIEVKCLSREDALDLFRKRVRDITLGSHPDIPELAKKVAQKCQGLPLALNIIGETMSFKEEVHEWHKAIKVLDSNAAKFSGMGDKILPILKYSYDDLNDEQLKSCLQYCALFPEDYIISKGRLIEYWKCEGIIDENKCMEDVEDQGYEIISSLIRSSLLMESEMEDKVYMHDVVQEMALWITSNFGDQKDNFVVIAGADLYGIPKSKNWNAAKRISLMANKINYISCSMECLQLTTLFLQRNKITLGTISGEFFKSMPRLVVLDLSDNRDLSELPNGISKLVSLKYLNISLTAIKSLPVGLQELKNLIHLDLEWTQQLLSFVGIYALLNLKVLKLYYSGVAYSPETKEQLIVLENLEILTINIDSDSGLDEFLSSQKMIWCTQALQISGCQLESSDIWRLTRMEKLRELYFNECTISEIKIDTTNITRDMVFPLQSLKNAFFLSLSQIFLISCKCPKDLTWLMFAPNLSMLYVVGSQLEEIINKEKASEGEGEEIVHFQKLKKLELYNMPKLMNIYWKPLPFPCLKHFIVVNCPQLRKLPFNSESGSIGEKGLFIRYKEKEWLKGVQWENEATRSRFLPSCVYYGTRLEDGN